MPGEGEQRRYGVLDRHPVSDAVIRRHLDSLFPMEDESRPRIHHVRLVRDVLAGFIVVRIPRDPLSGLIGRDEREADGVLLYICVILCLRFPRIVILLLFFFCFGVVRRLQEKESDFVAQVGVFCYVVLVDVCSYLQKKMLYVEEFFRCL